MIVVLFIISLVFALPLALYAPDPESLSAVSKPSLKSRIRSSAATLAIGLGLILVAAATFAENHQIDPDIVTVFALSRQGIFEAGFVFELLTSSLLHINYFHLAGNLSVLLLLSPYERRVGWRRFTAVFFATSMAASLGELLWLPPQTAAMGASAGLCGLTAAYFLDYDEMTLSHWIKGLMLVLFIVGLYSYLGPNHRDLPAGTGDPIAHLVGACFGAAYVFFFPARAVSRRQPV